MRSYKSRLSIDWAPDVDKEEVHEKLSRTKATYPKKSITTFCPLTVIDANDEDAEPEPRLPRRLWAR